MIVMSRAAIFVDAGYLFAQGSAALVGAKQPRSQIQLNETAAIAELNAVAYAKADSCALLRIYWYDGVISFKGPTLDQERLAHMDNVKLRLGFINSSGQQKGVDSLIVTDLIDLARNHAITDAVLLSGDEDVRIGVQIAQQFGVRAHLIGIAPARGSQSKNLLQEADTTTEWDKVIVSKFLSVALPTAQSPIAPATAIMPAPHAGTLSGEVVNAVEEFVKRLDASTVTKLRTHWQTSGIVPPEFDGPLLAISRSVLNRDLAPDERKQL